MGKSDLRLYARFECATGALLLSKLDNQLYGVSVLDIGLGGVQLRSANPLPVDIEMSLQIELTPGKALSFNGKVRYSSGQPGEYSSGFKFAPETQEERVSIANFVHEIFQNQWEALAS